MRSDEATSRDAGVTQGASAVRTGRFAAHVVAPNADAPSRERIPHVQRSDPGPALQTPPEDSAAEVAITPPGASGGAASRRTVCRRARRGATGSGPAGRAATPP